MTSATYSNSKLKQGRSFFLWSLFTGKTTMIIYLSLLTFLCLSVSVFGLGLSLQMPSQAATIWEGASFFTIFITTELALVFTFVFSIKEFSYLHDKRKSDMFGALPASRRTIFFSKLAAAIAQSATPVLLIMTFLAIMNQGSIPDHLGMSGIIAAAEEPAEINLLYKMLQIIVGLIANAAFLGFLSVCCGRVADKILTYIIINAAYPIAAVLVQVLPGSFVIGYTPDINEVATCALSPITAVASINPAYWGGFAVLFGALSFILLPKRKAECAQSHFAFKAPLVITKVLVSFAAGMVFAYLFGIIFSAVSADKPAFVAGWVMGSFIAYFVIQIIFAKGFRRFGVGMIPYAALAVCFAVIMLVINTGFFGYENYVPSVDEVESVSLVGDEQLIINGRNVIDGTITDRKQIEDCIKGHKEVLEFQQSQNPSISTLTFGTPYYSETDYSSFDEGGTVRFKYKLKDGSVVSRFYGEYWGAQIDFTSSETYINNTNMLFLVNPEYATDIYFESDYEDEDYNAEFEIDGVKYAVDDSVFGKQEKRVELIEALKSDILANGIVSGRDVCYVNITYGTGDALFDNYTDVGIKRTYEKTIEYLKKNAVKEEKTKVNKSNV